LVSGSQALEKVWLFSVPLHPMLILSKHLFLEFQKHQARNIFNNTLTCRLPVKTAQSKTAPFQNGPTCLLCICTIYIIILPNFDTNVLSIFYNNIELYSLCNSGSRLLVGTAYLLCYDIITQTFYEFYSIHL